MVIPMTKDIPGCFCVMGGRRLEGVWVCCLARAYGWVCGCRPGLYIIRKGLKNFRPASSHRRRELVGAEEAIRGTSEGHDLLKFITFKCYNLERTPVAIHTHTCSR